MIALATITRIIIIIPTVVLLKLLSPSHAQALTNYTLDTSHTKVGFEVSHLKVSSVEGKFKKFDGSFRFDEKTLALEDLQTKIDVKSIDTSDEKRDEHLRGPDFFEAEKKDFGNIMFKQTQKATMKENKPVDVRGEITIKGVSKPLTLKVTYTGAVTDPWGNRKVGFKASGAVERRDFNITWNKALDGGGFVIGNTVTIDINGEGTAQVAKTEDKK